MIQGFMGRSKEIVNIPSKPTPEGFKIWCLSNGPYILNWIYHSKRTKRIDLDDFWTDWCGLFKTEAVMVDLVKQEGIYNDFRYMVWVDNLFTSAKLFRRLKEEGFGAAGTVRLSNTKRERIEGSSGTAAQRRNQQLEPNRGLPLWIMELRTKYEKQIPWGTFYGTTTENQAVLILAWKDSRIVPLMTTVFDGKAFV